MCKSLPQSSAPKRCWDDHDLIHVTCQKSTLQAFYRYRHTPTTCQIIHKANTSPTDRSYSVLINLTRHIHCITAPRLSKRKMATIQPITQSSNYDYLRRKNSERLSSSSIGRESSFRHPPVRQPNDRISNGTVSTTMTDMTSSSGHDTIGTAMTEPPAYSKKLVVVGDGGCGKTCLLISYAEGRFPEVNIACMSDFKILMSGSDISPRSLKTTSQ